MDGPDADVLACKGSLPRSSLESGWVALAQFYLWNPLLRETLDVVNQQALDAAPFENARSNEKVGET